MTSVDLIADYLLHLRRIGRTQATIDTYSTMLERLDRDLPVGLASACYDELVAAIYTDERSNATRALYRAAVRNFFAWCTDEDKPDALDFDPARRLPPVRVRAGRPRPVTPAELAAILARAAWPYRGWFLLASHAGARCTEIAQMNREDIAERDLLLHGKGGEDRVVPTHPLVWQYVQRQPPGPVVLDHRGRLSLHPVAFDHRGRLSRQRVSLLGNAELDRVGFPAVTMHRLRHTFLTRAYDVCRDIRAVQRLAGHANVNTTAGYIQVDEAVMRQAVEGLAAAG